MGKKKFENELPVAKRGQSSLAKTVGAVGVASLLGLASPSSAEMTSVTQNLDLIRDLARQGRLTGHPVLDEVLGGVKSVTAQSVCHTDSHSSSHTSGGGTDNHTSSRDRVLHQC